MGIGDAEDLEHALDGAVLAIAAVQGIERDVGLQLGEHLGDVAANLDARDAIADAFQRPSTGRAAAEADLTLDGPTAHQHCDMLAHQGS